MFWGQPPENEFDFFFKICILGSWKNRRGYLIFAAKFCPIAALLMLILFSLKKVSVMCCTTFLFRTRKLHLFLGVKKYKQN